MPLIEPSLKMKKYPILFRSIFSKDCPFVTPFEKKMPHQTQEVLDQHAKGAQRSNSRATSADPPKTHHRRTTRGQTAILGATIKPTRERISRSAVPEDTQLSPTEGGVNGLPGKQPESADAGNAVMDERSVPPTRLKGDVSPMPERVNPLVGCEIEVCEGYVCTLRCFADLQKS